MPDTRSHRGPHPVDRRQFAPAVWPRLVSAVRELSWLLSRGYASKSSLKLVGDRYALTERQRIAVARCACADRDRLSRVSRRVSAGQLRGQKLLLDGYNVLTTVEAALAAGVILCGRDGCYRDMASVHGTYRKVEETLPALQQVGNLLASVGVTRCLWYLDSPVSNSGRLKKLILETCCEQNWDHEVELVPNPDTVLTQAREVVATADSGILDRCQRWLNLAREVIEACVPTAFIVDLSLSGNNGASHGESGFHGKYFDA